MKLKQKFLDEFEDLDFYKQEAIEEELENVKRGKTTKSKEKASGEKE